jgi:hypothetical protein
MDLVVGPKHPLAKKKSIKGEDLRKEKFILRELGAKLRPHPRFQNNIFAPHAFS